MWPVCESVGVVHLMAVAVGVFDVLDVLGSVCMWAVGNRLVTT